MSNRSEISDDRSGELLSTDERIQNTAIELLKAEPKRSLGLYALVRTIGDDFGFNDADASAVLTRGEPPLRMNWLKGQVELTDE